MHVLPRHEPLLTPGRLTLAAQECCEAQLKAVTLTKDHLAIYPAERARIEKCGGFVSREGRLNGRIQVSRAFGDAQFKKVVQRGLWRDL